MLVGVVHSTRPGCASPILAQADAASWRGSIHGPGPTMDYQLVIKFWRKSLEDESFLATIESELKLALEYPEGAG